MGDDLTEIKKTIHSLIEIRFLPIIRANIKDHKHFIEICRAEFTELQRLIDSEQAVPFEEAIAKTIHLNEKIKQLISRYFEKDNGSRLGDLFPDYIHALEKFISETPESIVEEQDENRFRSVSTDKFHIKLGKFFKNIFLNVSNLLISISNPFRKLLKKPIKEKKKWGRTIQLRNLRHRYFFCALNEKLFKLLKKYYRQRSLTAQGLWNIYESLDEKLNSKLFNSKEKQNSGNSPINPSSALNDLRTDLTTFEESLINEIKLLIDPVFFEYEDAFLKAGTFEYPKRKYNRAALRKKEKYIHKLFTSIHNGWNNNFAALGDDWQMNNEVYLIRYFISAEFQKIKSELHTNIDQNLTPHTERMILFLKEIKESLNQSIDNTELIPRFTKIKEKIRMGLTNKMIPDFIRTVPEQNLSGIIAEFDNIIQEQINSINPKRLLVKTDAYNKEIKESDIDYFSPKEILEYSAAPKFFNTTSKLRSSINTQLQQIQNDISEIDHLSEFTIDSAINKFELDLNNEQSKIIASEGIDRALKRLSETERGFQELLSRFNNELSDAIVEFKSDLKNLAQTEKIFDIRINLAKAKTLQTSKKFRQQIIKNVRNALPQIYGLFKKSFLEIKNHYRKTREFFGFVPGATVIASEVSDYLAETQSAFLRLPYVYQRLFEIKPLEDKRFFFGRELELKELEKALANWKKEKFAPTIIVGEKGSGATSLINNFLTSHENDYEIIRCFIDHPLSEINDFLKLLSEVLESECFNSIDDAITYINSLKGKQIIAIENLQRLFLRKVDGFKVLKILFEIMSKTNKNIFWISTCTIYGWIYLDKTIHAADYFSYIINFHKLNEEQVTDLLSKRHRVSGYNISYEVDEITLKSKSYKKLSDDERQSFLRNKYFTELNKFAQSNISLAFIFWLRSAKEIVNDTIRIGSPPDLDYSFLENLSNEKVFTLAALLIHDGLTIKDHSKIFYNSTEKSRLLFLLMYDDGIIIKQNDLYLINPLLYRQIVGLLKSKNIIH